MTKQSAITWVALALCCLGTVSESHAAPLRVSYASCEKAIAAELGDGRLRSDLVKAHQNDGAGRHWINVRHRGADAHATAKFRVVCETASSGSVAALSLDPGRWKSQRANRPPVAIDD